MRILSHMGIYGYSVVLFVLMGGSSLCDWFFVSCRNCLILGLIYLFIYCPYATLGYERPTPHL
jgi:hypothetical protein